MFQKGDLIIYHNEGVCRVEEIGPLENLSGNGSRKLYYKLSPVYGKGVIFTPVETKLFMRPIISKTEAEKLITKIPTIKCEPLDTINRKQLAKHYESSIASHQCEDLVQLLKTVYSKSENLIKHGKKPGQTDQRYMKRAEELLHGELAVALDIPCEEVPKFIKQKLKKLEKEKKCV